MLSVKKQKYDKEKRMLFEKSRLFGIVIEDKQNIENLDKSFHNIIKIKKRNDDMIKIVICDDEKKDRHQIKEFINSYEEEFNIKFCLKLFASGEEFLKSKFIPDILFLDIVMEKKDGIQVGTEVKKRKAEVYIIYTTNLDEKIAIAVNHVHSFGYLVKPIEKESFFQILSDAVMQIQRNRNHGKEKVRFLSDSNTIIELYPMDIYYFEYHNRKIKIAEKDNTIICKGKIHDIADRMEEYGFFMAHQSFVVNLYHIERISAQMLVMRNEETIPLAQKRASALRKRLMQIAKELIGDGGSK